MCTTVSELVNAARRLVSQLDAARLRADDAVTLVETFGELERLVAAGRTIAAGRVAETRAWRARGATSARAFVAQRTGITLKEAAAALQTAHAVAQLPAVRDALVSGRLSAVQAAEVSAAGAADASSVPALLTLAEQESVEALRERCRDVVASAAGDRDATERIRRARYLRHWTQRDGSVRVEGMFAPDDAAPLLSFIDSHAHRLLDAARRGGTVERLEAYAADAVSSLVREDATAKTVVNVVVSAEALERGTTVAGETSRIEGIGPVSVPAVQRLVATGAVKIVERRGVDVSRVVHVGRMIPAVVRTALEGRDPVCVVPGCNRANSLEIDHVVPLSQGGLTTIANLARLCRWHHAQKTHHGWRLSGAPGSWQWTRGAHRERRYSRRE